MLHPSKLRRALAALTLILAATFATAPDAGAAVHRPGGRAAQARTVQRAQARGLAGTLTGLLRKAGIEIDPNGLINRLLPILTDGGW